MFRQHKSGGKELHGDTAYCTVWNGIFCYYIYTVVVYMAYSCTTSEYWIKGKWYILCWRWYCYSTVIYNPLLDLCIFLFHTTSTEHQYTLIYMCVYINIYIFFSCILTVCCHTRWLMVGGLKLVLNSETQFAKHSSTLLTACTIITSPL